nr:uncharacterized protein LOC108948891 [Nicotiana tomentosiformis]
MECVQTFNYTVLINGEPSEPFNATRGLRQGDPISPFMFAIAMEYLSRKLNELKDNKTFQFHPRCAKLGITHLSFADDLLLFVKGNLSSITALHKSFVWSGSNTITKKALVAQDKVPWKCLMFRNDARPNYAKFTMWLELQGRLSTTDKLVAWITAVAAKKGEGYTNLGTSPSLGYPKCQR